jgi:hypothetical protein
MEKKRFYSPTQAAVASFFGGPGAFVYTLWSNFRALDKEKEARQVLLAGTAFLLVVFAIVPFLPEKFPNYVIPISYTVTARLIVEKYQLSKRAIQESERFGFASAWNVFGISVGFLVSFFLVFMIWMLALGALGLWTPPPTR